MKTHQVSVRTVRWERRWKVLQESPTRLSPFFFPTSFLMSKQARLGTTVPSQPSRRHQWELLCCEMSLLCQNLKLTQGDAAQADITPVIAGNRKNLGSCFTEIKKNTNAPCGSLLSTLIIEGCLQTSLVLYLAWRESNSADFVSDFW